MRVAVRRAINLLLDLLDCLPLLVMILVPVSDGLLLVTYQCPISMAACDAEAGCVQTITFALSHGPPRGARWLLSLI